MTVSHSTTVSPSRVQTSASIIAVGRIEGQQPTEWSISDQYTRGRARYYEGGLLEQCATPAERSGYISAEADCRRAERQAMWDISFDEWCANRGEYDREAWEL